MTKDSTNNLSGAYALDAVNASDRTAYETALTGSEEARSEATELQDTAVLLGLAVTPVAPSPELRERLFAQIAVTPQLPRLEPEVVAGPAETKARLRWTRTATTVTTMAAALALIVGGIAVGTTSLHPEPSFQAQQLAALDTAADKQEIAADVTGGGTATLVWSSQLATSAVVMDGVPALDDDSVYQLWYIGAEGPRSAGFIAVSPGDTSWRVLDGAMELGDTVGVTVEPKGGSEQPTTTPIVAISSI
jgi:anti-sigma-K factor RskA